MVSVPELSRFYGIVITMYHSDHPAPHFHATHGSDKAKVGIGTGHLLAGRLPLTALRRVRKWERMHRDELLDNWERRLTNKPLRRIEPLP